jgi:hypothetical protein
MAREMFRTKLLHNLLRLALLVGLLPMSNHMFAMQTMRMDEAMASSMGAPQGNVTTENTEENSASSCCDAICPSSLAWAFVIPQSICVALYGGSERILYSALILRSIYLQVAIPPPKA